LTKRIGQFAEVTWLARDLAEELNRPGWYCEDQSVPFYKLLDAHDWDALFRDLDLLEIMLQKMAEFYGSSREYAPIWSAETALAEIAPLYVHIFNKNPSISRSSADNKAGGGYVRFTQYFERETNPRKAPDLPPETIAAAWNRSRRKTKHVEEWRKRARLAWMRKERHGSEILKNFPLAPF
jgi:hypothetical protein